MTVCGSDPFILIKLVLNHISYEQRVCVRAVRSGFLHLAEALAYHRDTEVPLRAIIAMLKAGERCNAEAELIGKGISGIFVVVAFETLWDLALQTLQTAIKYNNSNINKK